MGKAIIKSGGENGQYQIEVKFNRSFYDKRKSKLELNISSLIQQQVTETDFLKRKIIDLKIASCQKEIDLLTSLMPEDYSTSAWCADLTENISGEVGTVEVPGEVGTIQIQPGYEGKSSYEQARDGQLTPNISLSPSGSFYNLAMLPGWQKWKPLFRYATITSIDGDIANIVLDDIRSTQQNLQINQSGEIENVEIEYMACNGSAFSGGDNVLVMFTNQKWENPKIIGFKDNPKSCGEIVLVQSVGYCFLWDTETNEYYQGAYDNTGNPITDYPVLTSSLADWMSGKVNAGLPLYETYPCRNRTPQKETCTVPVTTGVWKCSKTNDESNTCPNENGTPGGANKVTFSLTQTNNPPSEFIYDSETKYEFPVSNLSLIAEPNNITTGAKSFSVQVDWVNIYYRANNGGERFEDESRQTSTSTFNNPFGTISALSTEDFDTVGNGLFGSFDYHGESQKEENVPGSGNIGIVGEFSKKTIAQLWYFSGSKVKKETRPCAQDFEAGGWYNDTGFLGFGPAPDFCQWTTTYYESSGPGIWGSLETYENTDTIDPFGMPQNGNFVSAAEKLRSVAESEAGGPWADLVFRPSFSVSIIG